MSAHSKELVVDIWSDFVCPWCWVAKRRFENALDSVPYKDRVRINFRSYRIGSNHVAEPITTVLKRKLGGAGAADTMMSAVTQQALATGLDYRFDTMLFGDTADAHVLVKAVEGSMLKARLMEALYEQSISQGQSLFDRANLESIALSVGVPIESVQLAWRSAELRRQMQGDERVAARFGSGVPLFVFNDSFSLSGAQPQKVFVQALDRMYGESIGEEEAASGQVCGLTGCH